MVASWVCCLWCLGLLFLVVLLLGSVVFWVCCLQCLGLILWFSGFVVSCVSLVVACFLGWVLLCFLVFSGLGTVFSHG